MAFLEGYFDESGTHGYAENLIVSGFVAESNKWCQFAKAWDQRSRISQFRISRLNGSGRIRSSSGHGKTTNEGAPDSWID